MKRFSLLTCVLALLTSTLPGCSSNTAKLVPVEGKVLFADGKPLPKGTRLIFNPNEGKMGSATAVTDETGSFQAVHQSGSKGAAIGKYSVQLVSPEGEQKTFYKAVPSKYYEGTGDLVADVNEGMSPLHFTLKK
ncbi:MAG TPA: hypothetical protein PLN21_14695 [Gemmatales bacterium]|nr:hypothetical protein [Gemmatales bacterium]